MLQVNTAKLCESLNLLINFSVSASRTPPVRAGRDMPATALRTAESLSVWIGQPLLLSPLPLRSI